MFFVRRIVNCLDEVDVSRSPTRTRKPFSDFSWSENSRAMTADNLAEARDAGAYGIAAIRSLWC